MGVIWWSLVSREIDENLFECGLTDWVVLHRVLVADVFHGRKQRRERDLRQPRDVELYQTLVDVLYNDTAPSEKTRFVRSSEFDVNTYVNTSRTAFYAGLKASGVCVCVCVWLAAVYW